MPQLVQPRIAVPCYIGEQPAKGKRAIRVVVTPSVDAGETIPRALIDLGAFNQQHGLEFVQGVHFDVPEAEAGRAIDLIHIASRFRIRAVTPSQIWSPMVATDDLRFEVRTAVQLANIPLAIWFFNFEVAAAQTQFASAMNLSVL